MKKLFIFLSIFSLGFNLVNAQCSYSIVLTDDFGDGWQGGQVEIFVAGLSAGIYTLTNGAGPETYYFSVQTGDEIRATYTAGQWPQENEYHIYDANGTEIFADGTGGNPPSANDALVGTGSCPSCPQPISLSTTNIQITTAVLNWTESGNATQWQIEYGLAGFAQGSGTLLTNITANPYNLNGLLSATTYDWYVRSVCGSGDTSTWIGPESFTTQCDVIMAPFSENFENGGNIANCWTTTSSSGELWEFGTPPSNAHAAPQDHTTGSGYFAWIDDSENPPSTDLTLTSPFIDISPLSSPTLYFWRYSDDEGSGVSAILYVNIWDGANWNNHVATYSGNTSGWHQEIIDLTTLTITGPIQIQFVVDENNGGYQDDISIDDVQIIEPISCPEPDSLYASNILITSATLGWNEVGSATEWEIEYGASGFTQGTGTLINTTNNPYSLSGLSGNTNYDWYVRAVCGSGDSSTWGGPTTFQTQCNALSAPYSENFENGGLIPSCWNTNSSTGETWNFNLPPGNAHSAPYDHTTGSGYFAWIDDSESPATSDISLESPFIDISSLSAPTLYFYRYSDDEGSGVSATLYVDIWDGAQWNNHVATFTGNSNGWYKETVDFSSLTISGPVQIRFVVDEVNSSYFDDIAIDDVEIINLETCSRPDSLIVNAVGETTADVGWNETGSATEWEIEYGLSGFSLGMGTVISNITDNPHTISGLSANTNYEFYVRSICSIGDSSWWAGPVSFTTSYSNPTNCEMGIPITDGGCIEIPIGVSGVSDQMGSNVELQEVHLILQHAYDADIIVSLESPSGQIDTLTQQNGGNGDNYGIIDGTCSQYTNFTMSATTPISSGAAPFVDDYIPQGDFSVFDDGSNPNGTWILHICDVWSQDQGTFEFAQLVFSNILPPAVMKINEIDVTQAGQDTAEFVELYDDGYGNFPLDDYCLVFYDGAADTVYAVYDLDGYTTDSIGYFVLGDSTVANVQMILTDSIQNGADAIALYQDTSSSFPIGSGITTNNITDAVVYSTDDPFDLQLLQLLNAGQPQINENVTGKSGILSLSRLPNGTGSPQNTNTYYVSIPTPGDSNLAIPVITWTDSVFTEDYVNNDGSIINSITVQLQNDKFSHTGIFSENTEFYCQNIPAGLSPVVNIVSDTVATITFSGNAVAHMDSDDVADAILAFTDAAFTVGDTIYCKNYKNDSLQFNFFDEPLPNVIYYSALFYEDTLNHGGIANQLHIHLISTAFPVDSGILSDTVFYTVANVPQGLSVQIEVNDSTDATVSLLGNAVHHTDNDDVNNLTIAFLDTTFVNYTAAEVLNSTNDTIKVDFYTGLSDSCEINSFSFTLQTGPAVIDHGNRTVNIEVNQYADLGYLIPAFTLSQGATAYINTIEQISGTTPNDYSNPVTYSVVAEDGQTNCDWIITVTQANAIQSEKFSDLKIFPNPANNRLNIVSPTRKISRIQLISITGETILQSDASNKQQVYILSLKQIPSGIYTLKLQYDEGIMYKKVVITK